MDWDDLRFFNAVATAGSVGRAAQTLECDTDHCDAAGARP